MFDPRRRQAALSVAALAAALTAAPALAQDVPPAQRETPASMVQALHTAFGEHHARAVHTKGVTFEGEFTPAKEAQSLSREPIFTGGKLPVVARYSLFAGVPDLADNDDAASPAGFGIKIKAVDGGDVDLVTNQHNNFIVPTVDEFAVFLRALAASGPGVAHPTPVEQFLGQHPGAAQFLATRTYPVSYAQATYFGVNSFKFTNAKGQSTFVRYRLVPRAGEHYLSPDERKAKSATYLQDEIVQRVRSGPIIFDWYAQVAAPGDKIEDPSIAWPDSRRLVKLGTFTLTRQPADVAAADRALTFLAGQPHPGIDPADPMLVLRNAAYPISFRERQ